MKTIHIWGRQGRLGKAREAGRPGRLGASYIKLKSHKRYLLKILNLTKLLQPNQNIMGLNTSFVSRHIIGFFSIW